MTAKELCDEIRRYCRANADEAIVKKYSRYFKEGYDAYGLSQKLFDEKVVSILSDKKINMKLVLNAGKLLVKSGKYEETSFAIILLKNFSKQFTKETFTAIGKWFETGIINWAHTDIICGELISQLFERKIISLKNLSGWRQAENKYQRRAVPVSMLTLLKSSKNYVPLFAFIEPLMMDDERMVHQGLGWFLREAWKRDKKVTEKFLLKWKDQAPRKIYQYATEKMTPEQKKRFKKAKKK